MSQRASGAPREGSLLFETERLERADFLERPNRFTVRFSKDGREGTAYVANPGRMGEILLPGTTLLLAPRPRSVLRFEAVGATWESRWPGDRPRSVFLNTGMINELAARLIEGGLIPELAAYRIERREVACGSSRIDFLLARRSGRGRPYFLEVKSVTLAEEGLALFPDAATLRGRRHLEELARCGKDRRAGVLFLVQGEADRFLPDFHNDLEFARTFRSVLDRIEVLPYRLDPALTGEGRLAFRGRPERLAIPLRTLEAGVRDGGLYLLVLELPRDHRLAVGSLGRRLFPRGSYVYVGSARRALASRIERHRRIRKIFHWHIDSFRAECSSARAFPIRAAAVGECDLAREMERISDEAVEGFGCSDCGCGSHLFRFSTPPIHTPAFQEVLTWMRHRPAARQDLQNLPGIS